MEDKVVSFEKGIHREPSLGAVGELSDCVNLYSEGTEMKMMPHVEGVRNVPEGWVCRYVHENGGDYSHLVMVGEKSVESDDEATADAVETEAAVDASANAQETVVVDGGSADGEASGTVAVVGWLPMEYESGEEVVEVMELESGENVRNITSIGNVLVISTNVKMYYWLWSEGEYLNYTFDDLEDLDIQFALDGKVCTRIGSKTTLNHITDNNDLFDELVSTKSGATTIGINNGNCTTKTIDVCGDDVGKSTGFNTLTVTGVVMEFDGLSTNKKYQYFIEATSTEGVRVGIAIKYANYEKYYMYGFPGIVSGKSIKMVFDVIPRHAYGNYNLEKYYDRDNLGDIEEIILIVSSEGQNSDSVLNDLGGEGLFSIYTTSTGLDIDTKVTVKREEENLTALMGSVDKFIADYGTNKNRFMFPFFVRYAIKLFDGTYIKPSSPILMLPSTTEAPCVYIDTNGISSTDNTRVPIISAISAKLQYKILNFDALKQVKDKGGVVKSIVIAVTPPIYTYKSSPTDEDMLTCLYCTEDETDSVSYVKLDSIDSASYCKYGKNYIDKELNKLSGSRLVLPYYDDKEFINNLENASEFRIISEIELDDIVTDEDGTIADNEFKDVDIDSGVLSGLNGRQMLSDNTVSWKQFYAKALYPYNNRLTLGNVKETLFKGYAPQLMTGFKSVEFSQKYTSCRMAVEIYIVKDNQNFFVRKNVAYINLAGVLYFYYPDSNAKSVTIYQQKIGPVSDVVKVRSVALKEHPKLDGAYWFGNFEELPVTKEVSDFDWDDYPDESKSMYTPNKVISTIANNPFVIDSGSETQIGMGEVQKLISNTKALSQGQFGQHPVLAFCSDGIWAMAVSSEGGFSAVQPVSRDVVSNVESITQTDSAVAFVTDRGLMMIDGSEVKELCQFMDNRENFDVEGTCAQLVDGFEELFVEESDSWLGVLGEAKLAYDYQNSLLWVMPQQDVDDEDLSRNKWYAVSLKNGEVYGYVCPDVSGRGLNRFYGPVSVVPGYPQSYMQMKNVFRRSSTVASRMVLAKFGYVYGNGKSKGWLVTRAIPFGNAYAMKMLYDMKVEKMFGEGSSAKVAVFVSNDRVHWGRLTSMKGRSFKWYRFAVFCDMSDMDRLTGLVCRIDERRGNKLR